MADELTTPRLGISFRRHLHHRRRLFTSMGSDRNEPVQPWPVSLIKTLTRCGSSSERDTLVPSESMASIQSNRRGYDSTTPKRIKGTLKNRKESSYKREKRERDRERYKKRDRGHEISIDVNPTKRLSKKRGVRKFNSWVIVVWNPFRLESRQVNSLPVAEIYNRFLCNWVMLRFVHLS